ncbi:MAG: bifunctional alpha,alpha-trehalose-phosphate synthase (UDP-forming)/trehalose-phosphatase [Chitinispirillaceae bacterium]
MRRIILVSNRLPITVDKRKGVLHYHHSVGGLATGLDTFHQSRECMWIGWPGIASDRTKEAEKNQITETLSESRCIPVFLSRAEIDKFYNGFSNRTIWPLFHYFPQHAVFQSDLWDSYLHVNRVFCEEIVKQAKEGDLIWVHDYQLMLLPSLLRERMPNATIGFFLHIPFPSLETFRLLPWRNELLQGLMGSDLIGFHTYDYLRHFLNSTRRLLGYENTFCQISYQGRTIKSDVFPMGIDYKRFSQINTLPEVQKEEKSIRRKVGNQKLIIAIDRLDYTKGILQRLEAFDLFLDRYPRQRGKVTMFLIEVPSRTSVESYRQLKKQIDELIGRINGKHGNIGWVPVLNLYRTLPFSTLGALYHTCDIALVTPLRDGMNLVAKEYVATKQDTPGVLILSEMAGAAREMGEALIVNPNNIGEIAETIREALEMSEEEQKNRMRNMQTRLRRYDVRRWAQDFVAKLEGALELRRKLKTHQLSDRNREHLLKKAAQSQKTLILLDYDGTLVNFQDKPQKASPDKKLLKLLKKLNAEPANTVVIISGRDKNSLEKWFGDTELTLCAEHGVWIKEPNGQWDTIEPQQDQWKKEITPLMQLFTDRTPGALLEEKDYSLAFHYRNADPELADLRVRELMDALIHLVSNLNLSVMEGNRVIEVKNAGINKGIVASKFLERSEWDLVVAAGDDVTDEYLFSSLPTNAYSIKVGLEPSKARFSLQSVEHIRELLQQIGDVSSPAYQTV